MDHMMTTRSGSFFVYSRRGEPAGREDGYILLHASRPVWMAVNRTTLEIAGLLDGGSSVDETVARLVSRYDLSRETAGSHVRHVAEELASRGFLQPPTPIPVRSPVMRSIFFHLTTRCNLRCRHCYAAGPQVDELPSPVIFRAVDELKSLGGRSVTLSGGEPLLHSALREIVKHAGQLGITSRLLSNGTLIDGETAAFLAGELVDAVQISIDGATGEVHDATRGPGTFARTLRGMEALQKAGMNRKIIISTTVMEQNLHDLPNIIRLAQSLGIPKIRFLPLRKEGRAAEYWNTVGAHVGVREYEGIFDDLFSRGYLNMPGIEIGRGLSGFLLETPEEETGDSMWCTVGRAVTLATDGDAFPCALTMRPELRLGNIHREALSDMIHSDAMIRICRALSERRNLIDECAVCPWKNFCQAGCMGQALDDAGTLLATDTFCDYRKKAYAEVFDGFIEKFVQDGRGSKPGSG